jgi:3-methyladenine DNA glycosylase AlkD
MTLQEAMSRLESLGTDQVKGIRHREGAGERQFGVKLGDIRGVAKGAKSDHSLALELWQTGNTDARLLATLVIQPAKLSLDELEGMIREVCSPQLADWVQSYVTSKHPLKFERRQSWMDSDSPMVARCAWSLTADLVSKESQLLDLDSLLDRIEAELGGAPSLVQWTMNSCLAQIGISHPHLRERAVAIGEAIGVYRDYPVSKGCTSPFAPIWIKAMSERQQPPV